MPTATEILQADGEVADFLLFVLDLPDEQIADLISRSSVPAGFTTWAEALEFAQDLKTMREELGQSGTHSLSFAKRLFVTSCFGTRADQQSFLRKLTSTTAFNPQGNGFLAQALRVNPSLSALISDVWNDANWRPSVLARGFRFYSPNNYAFLEQTIVFLLFSREMLGDASDPDPASQTRAIANVQSRLRDPQARAWLVAFLSNPEFSDQHRILIEDALLATINLYMPSCWEAVEDMYVNGESYPDSDQWNEALFELGSRKVISERLPQTFDDWKRWIAASVEADPALYDAWNGDGALRSWLKKPGDESPGLRYLGFGLLAIGATAFGVGLWKRAKGS